MLLKTFALPLHANGLRRYLKELMNAQQRQEAPDRRIRVRDVDRLYAAEGGIEMSDDAEDVGEYEGAADIEHDGEGTRPRRSRRERPSPLGVATSSDGSVQTCSLKVAAAQLGRTPRQLRYMLEQGKIQAIRWGRFYRIPVAEIDRLLSRERTALPKRDKQQLINLRVLLQSEVSPEDTEGIHKAREAARKWMAWQRDTQRKTPRQLCEVLAAHPMVSEKTQQWPDMPRRIQQLLERVPPEMTWE